MKKRRMKDSKLKLNKQTIVNLDSKEMGNVKGGAIITIIIKITLDILTNPKDANQSADLICASINSCNSDCAICPE